MSDQTSPVPVSAPSKPEHSGMPGNGSTSRPSIETTVRQEGWESSKLCRLTPPGVTWAWLKPCRAGAHQPSVERREAKSTVAAQYAGPDTVGCTRVPSANAQVPPLIVGTSEVPSSRNPPPRSVRLTTSALAGRCSCLSWSTTTAHWKFRNVSEIRLRAPARMTWGFGPPVSTARLPPWSTASECPPPVVTVCETGPGTGFQSRRSVVARSTSGSSYVPPAEVVAPREPVGDSLGVPSALAVTLPV